MDQKYSEQRNSISKSNTDIANCKKDFFDKVYKVVRQIPEGKVTSYGAIASYLGAKKSARLVGWAMNAAHTIPDVPAHRVVNRAGVLTGKHHFETPSLMQEQLESEGVEVEGDKIKDFSKIFTENLSSEEWIKRIYDIFYMQSKELGIKVSTFEELKEKNFGKLS